MLHRMISRFAAITVAFVAIASAGMCWQSTGHTAHNPAVTELDAKTAQDTPVEKPVLLVHNNGGPAPACVTGDKYPAYMDAERCTAYECIDGLIVEVPCGDALNALPEPALLKALVDGPSCIEPVSPLWSSPDRFTLGGTVEHRYIERPVVRGSQGKPQTGWISVAARPRKCLLRSGIWKSSQLRAHASRSRTI